MFKFATLTSVVAATTAKATAKKTIAAVKNNAIVGATDIGVSGLSMPQSADIPSYTDIQKSQDTTDVSAHKYCAWAGGAWTAVKATPTDSTCDFTSKAGAAVLKAQTAADLAKPVTLDDKLSFEDFFDTFAIGEVAQTPLTSTVQSVLGGECSNSFNAVTWKSMAPAVAEKANAAYKKAGVKTVAKTASWQYSWIADNNAINSSCFMSTQLPAKWAGGLVLTHVKNDFVNMAVHISATLPRYFSQHTLKSQALGKTGKIPIAAASSVEVFMQSGAKAPATAMTAADTTSVTFTRIGAADLALLIAKSGGAVVWIIIGILVCLGCLAGFLLYKMGKCCVREIEGEKGENEFYQEDCYVRV